MTTKSAAEIAKIVNKHLKNQGLSLGSNPSFEVKYIPTGVLPFDTLTQGGFPRGRFTEIYGANSSLKSYLGLCGIREVQKAGGVGALIDTERAFNPEWARHVGVDIDNLIIWPPREEDDDKPLDVTGELAIDTAEALVRAGVDIIVFDSIAAMLPQSEQEKSMAKEKVQPGRLAALMSLASRKLTAANRNTAVVWINQTRTNLSITFGSSETTTGGKAMGYYASTRVAIRQVGKIYEDGEIYLDDKMEKTKRTVAIKIKMTLEKARSNRQTDESWFVFDLDKGEVDTVGYLIQQGLEKGIITRPTNTSWVLGEHKITGKAAFREWLETTGSEVPENGDRSPVEALRDAVTGRVPESV